MIAKAGHHVARGRVFLQEIDPIVQIAGVVVPVLFPNWFVFLVIVKGKILQLIAFHSISAGSQLSAGFVLRE